MMGVREPQKELFSYQVDLDKRVRPNHPLRAIERQIDFTFVRDEVGSHYGYNGHKSEDPAVIAKMMFLLFYDDVSSERELMRVIAERMDYLWFLGYGLDDEIPNHSVLSKARRRWGVEVFESFFMRIVSQCIAAGLVDGKKIHMDASLIEANASKDSVLQGSPEWIAALKQVYQAAESKLDDTTTPKDRVGINDRMVSATDPDAGLTRMGSGQSKPRYHHHRAVDDAHGVITAVETTSGTIAENKKLMDLVEQHERNTDQAVETIVADSKYGTVENYVACQQVGITTHMGNVLAKQTHNPRCRGIFPDSLFIYDSATDTYRCPGGQTLVPRRLHPVRRTMEYHTARGVCAACALRLRCTRARYGRTIKRHEHQTLLDQARAQARSPAAYQDRRRRKHLIEGSFADAANNHGFKRARWRRLWRQQIQDYLIATIQNVRILLKNRPPPVLTTGNTLRNVFQRLNIGVPGLFRWFRAMLCAITGYHLKRCLC